MTCRSETINDEYVWNQLKVHIAAMQLRGISWDTPPPRPVTQYDDEGREIVAEVVGVDGRGRDVWMEVAW